MPKEPEQMLVQQGIATLGWIEEMSIDQAVHDQHAAVNHHRRHGEDHREGHYQLRPYEDGNPVQRHAWGPQTEDGDHDLDRDCQPGDFGEGNQLRPYVCSFSRRELGTAKRDIGEPADIRAHVQHEHRPQKDSAEQIQVVAISVEAREGDIARSHHQRHEIHREGFEHHWHGKQEHHVCAVHGEQLVVKIGADDVALGMRQLQAHYQRQNSAEKKESKCGDDVALADGGVVNRTEPPGKATRLRPRMRQQRTPRVVRRVQDGFSGSQVLFLLLQALQVSQQSLLVFRRQLVRRHTAPGLDALWIGDPCGQVADVVG